MGAHSKQKGASFERKVCGQLSEWVTSGRRDDCFWRSSMSGGRATVRFKKGKKTAASAGDISAISREAHAFLSKFLVECKHVKSLSIQGALLADAGLLPKFWRILEEEAADHDRRPLLIAKQNNAPTLALITPVHAQTYFPGAMIHERARINFRTDCGEPATNGAWVSVFLLDELLTARYAAHRFHT